MNGVSTAGKRLAGAGGAAGREMAMSGENSQAGSAAAAGGKAATRPRKPGAAPAEANPGYVLDEQIGFLMRRAQQRHIAIFQRIMGDDGPTPTQFAAMAKLSAGEEISQNHLGRMTAMDPATIKGVIARLEERGLVERLPDPDDQRRLRVRLSAKGHAAIPALIEKARAITAATLAPLSREEAERLLALLTRLD
jgi:DNA-binding MarR family transcriptional regulator